MIAAGSQLINWKQLRREFEDGDLDVIVAAAPENTRYLAGVLIRTQISIRERLAIVVLPREDEPTFVVCDITSSSSPLMGVRS